MEVKAFVKSSLGFLRATATTVSIVHHTAAEYLFYENHWEDLQIPHKSEADRTVAWECFRYLHDTFESTDPEEFLKRNFRGHHDQSLDSSPRRGQLEGQLVATQGQAAPGDLWEAEWPYLRYAAESWFIHARRSIEISKDKFCDDSTCDWLQHRFFETGDTIRKPWIKLCGDLKMEVLAGEQTQLHIAVYLGLIPLIEKALPDLTKRTSSNWSPLHLAAKVLSSAYNILIAESALSLLLRRDQDGNTSLHEASSSGHLAIMKGLVQNLATLENWGFRDKINEKNGHGNTPLHLAFQFDHPETVAFLIENGADPNIKNSAQLTAPELGERLRRGDSLEILKQSKVEVEAKDIGELVEEGAEGLRRRSARKRTWRIRGNSFGRGCKWYPGRV